MHFDIAKSYVKAYFFDSFHIAAIRSKIKSQHMTGRVSERVNTYSSET